MYDHTVCIIVECMYDHTECIIVEFKYEVQLTAYNVQDI